MISSNAGKKRFPVALWPIVGIFFLLGIVVFFLFNMKGLGVVSSKISDLMPGESVKLSDIKYSQDYKDGEGIWELQAKEGHFIENDQILELKDVFLTLDTSNKTSYTIKGNEGYYNKKSSKITLEGDVLGTSASGYQIETSLLIYRQNADEIETDKPVQINGPLFRINGNGLYVDLSKNTFIVKKDVRTTIKSGDFFK